MLAFSRDGATTVGAYLKRLRAETAPDVSAWQTLAGEPALAPWSNGKREPEQGRRALSASLQRQDLLTKF
jgi:hypothetical protein